MNRLPQKARGTPGWKQRRAENEILDIMTRATTPQTGWDVYQKLRKSRKDHGYSGEVFAC